MQYFTISSSMPITALVGNLSFGNVGILRLTGEEGRGSCILKICSQSPGSHNGIKFTMNLQLQCCLYTSHCIMSMDEGN